VTTLFRWIVSFLGRKRSERTAIMTDDVSRRPARRSRAPARQIPPLFAMN
jgi:hypothetical protein